MSFINSRPHNVFIRNIVKLFGKKLAAKFPECRLPQSSLSSRRPTKSKVILYTTSANERTNSTTRMSLVSGKVAFEERNCSKEPNYVRELEELVGNDRVRFPTLIVNGKDLCGEEEVDDFPNKQSVAAMLNLCYTMQCIGMSL